MANIIPTECIKYRHFHPLKLWLYFDDGIYFQSVSKTRMELEMTSNLR